MITIGKHLPYSDSTERSLLGALFLHPESMNDVVDILKTADSFYDKRHQFIFKAMEHLYATASMDLMSVVNYLTTRGELEHAGGENYVNNLIGDASYISDPRSMAVVIQEDYVRREIIAYSNDLLTKGYERLDSAADLLDEAQRRIFEMTVGENKGFADFRQTIAETVQEIYERQKNDSKLLGISSGYKVIDEFSLGLKPGEMILIAARPSMGKTAFGLNICQNVALHEGNVVAIFSLEMDSKSLTERMISAQSRMNVRTGDFDDDGLENLRIASTKLAGLKVFIDDTSGISVNEMRSKLMKLKARQKRLDLVMIDYLQLMEVKGMESRQQEVSYISRQIKRIAKDLECPVLALSQLSRANEKRAGTQHRPMLSDLRESGAIEQDADIVMFIHRPEYYLKDKTPPELKNVAEIIFAKQRNGQVGTAYMTFNGAITRFDDMPAESREAAMRASK